MKNNTTKKKGKERFNMIKHSKILLFSYLFVFNVHAYEHDVTSMLISRNLDISSKSYLGWARVINDADKRKEYRLDDLDEKTIKYYVVQLQELSKKSTDFGGKLK